MKFQYKGAPGEEPAKGTSITQSGYVFKAGESTDVPDEDVTAIKKLAAHPHFEHQGSLPKETPVQRVVIVGSEDGSYPGVPVVPKPDHTNATTLHVPKKEAQDGDTSGTRGAHAYENTGARGGGNKLR